MQSRSPALNIAREASYGRAMITIRLPDEEATLALGGRLGRLVRAGDVIALHGDLGAGKTTLARGLIRAAVGPDVEAPSPTFTLLQTYDGRDVAGGHLDLFHFDLYRLENPDDVFELGWDDIAGGAALVEWPDKAGPHLPAARLDVRLAPFGDGRVATLDMPVGDAGGWRGRLDGV
jgi:tRNA threonylcarbamoyladenosine biosynthesis protein TsaE